MSKNKLKIEYAPGCFNDFEGTQEELNELVHGIEQLFGNKTPEELDAIGEPVTDEMFERMPQAIQEQLLAAAKEFENLEISKKKLH